MFPNQIYLSSSLSGGIWEIIQNLHSDSKQYTEDFPREIFTGHDPIYLSFSQLDMHRALPRDIDFHKGMSTPCICSVCEYL